MRKLLHCHKCGKVCAYREADIIIKLMKGATYKEVVECPDCIEGKTENILDKLKRRFGV